MKNFELQPFAKACLQLLALSALGYALWTIKGVVVYAGISLYISVLGRPLFKTLQFKTPLGKYLGPTGNAAITLMAIGAVLSGIVTWFFPLLIKEFSFLSTIEYDRLIASLEEEWNQLDAVLASFGINSQAELEQINRSLQEFASVGAISEALSGLIGSMGNVIIGVFSITFISFFLIREQELAHRFIDYITPKKHHAKIDEMVPGIKRVVTRYSFGILIQITLIFLLLSLGMSLIGVQGAVVLALTAAVFNLVPYVGPLIGASLGILLGMGQLYTAGIADPATTVDLLKSLYLLIGLFAVVQLLDNIVFQPLIFSNSVGAHPLEIFLVISIAGTLLGVGGMVFAVPAYSILRIVINTIKEGWESSGT
jgi:predicted PurR-regulated permease PerM